MEYTEPRDASAQFLSASLALRYMSLSNQSPSADLLSRICAVVDPFDAAWQEAAKGAAQPSLEDALRNIPAQDQPAFFRELLGVELECRKKFGERPVAESYHQRFPGFREAISEVFRESDTQPTSNPTKPLASASSTLQTGATLGSYTIVEPLGQGGMGQVFKATHRTMKRTVALKVISPKTGWTEDSHDRFRREIETVARLSHPNIVTAHDAAEVDGVHFLVMEYVNGIDLSRLVREQGPLSIEAAIDYVLQAARGLEHAHAEGIIHRDIKPGNLIVNSKGVVKVLDLGLARWQAVPEESGVDDRTLTTTGQVVGTVDFMSPEQALNTKNADERSDIYSLGCTLWYLLTGRSVYSGNSAMERLVAHREQPIPSVAVTLRVTSRTFTDSDSRSDVDQHEMSSTRSAHHAERDGYIERLDVLFRKMVAKKPAERIQTMTEAIAELEGLLNLLPQLTKSTTRIANLESGNLHHSSSAETASNIPSAGAETVIQSSSTHQRGWQTRWWLRVAVPIMAIFVIGVGGLWAIFGMGILSDRGRTPEVPSFLKAESSDSNVETLEPTLKSHVTSTASNSSLPQVSIKSFQADRETAISLLTHWPGTVLNMGLTGEIAVRELKELPEQPLPLKSITLGPISQLNSDPVISRRGLKSLSSVRGPLGSAALDALAESPLGLAELAGSDLTDDRVAGLARSFHWDHLNVADSPVTGRGFANWPSQSLSVLKLGSNAVTDANLLHIGRIESLGWLEVNEPLITDAGLASLSSLRALETLTLTGTKVTGPGLKSLVDLRRLRYLVLQNTPLTDDAIEPLSQMRQLRILDLRKTPLSRDAIERLRAALPDCIIQNSQDVIGGHESERDRQAAEWVIQQGGRVGLYGDSINVPSLQIQLTVDKVENLPAGPFRVREITFPNEKPLPRETGLKPLRGLKSLVNLHLRVCGIQDDDLQHLAESTDLESLNLHGNPITNRGLTFLKPFQHLRVLNLEYIDGLNDAGLAQLPPLTEIEYFTIRGYIHDVDVTDASLKLFDHSRQMRKLRIKGRLTGTGLESLKSALLAELDLTGTHWDEEKLSSLKNLPRLRMLDICGGKLTEVAMKHIASISSLERLSFMGVSVSDQAFNALRHHARLVWLSLAYETNGLALAVVRDLPNLLTLRVSLGEVSNELIQNAAAAPALNYFSSVESKISDDQLAPLAQAPWLTHLDLRGTPITDTGLKHLQKLRSLKTLNCANTRITAPGLSEFKAARPDVKVTH